MYIEHKRIETELFRVNLEKDEIYRKLIDTEKRLEKIKEEIYSLVPNIETELSLYKHLVFIGGYDEKLMRYPYSGAAESVFRKFQGTNFPDFKNGPFQIFSGNMCVLYDSTRNPMRDPISHTQTTQTTQMKHTTQTTRIISARFGTVYEKEGKLFTSNLRYLSVIINDTEKTLDEFSVSLISEEEFEMAFCVDYFFDEKETFLKFGCEKLYVKSGNEYFSVVGPKRF